MRNIIFSLCIAGAVSASASVLKVEVDHVVQETSRFDLTGSNIALWYEPWQMADLEMQEYVRELKLGLMRLPGGTWSNHSYWNGNGVRLGKDEFDLTKLKDGVWDVDYSDYAPGFCIEGQKHEMADYHGTYDVKALHEFVEKFGAEAVVTVNIGTGTPEMAAEWVRWANIKNDYNVRYWELGNELEGSWELGNILPDGTVITGDFFAKRYIAMASAMKAVDPTIKTGGPASSNIDGAFVEEVLRDAGDLVDFISFHTYPVENRVAKEHMFFDKVYTLEAAVDRFRGLIEQYQPERADEIELGLTEWHSQLVEDRITADLMNGLWHVMFVGELFRTGIDFANAWDVGTQTASGGHSLFYFDKFNLDQPELSKEELDQQYAAFDTPCIPKGQYWGLYLWNRFMGDRLIHSSLDESKQLYSVVTRTDDGLQVLFVNQSRETPQTVEIESTEPLSSQAVAVLLSHREYFWNPYTRSPQWSRRPEPLKVTLTDQSVTVPPFSALVLQVPFKGSAFPTLEKIYAPRVVKPEIELLMPESSPEDVPVEAWVLMPDSGSFDPQAKPLMATLKVKGPATLDHTQIRMNEGAGRFFIQPTGTGPIKVTASFGKKKATAALKALPVQKRTEILWRFAGEQALDGVSSDYALALSDTAKPNQQTVEISLSESEAPDGKSGLLILNSFPESLPKERIGGVVFDVRISHDFSIADPEAGILVALQSTADHWIPIGTIPLAGLKGGWQTIEVPIEDHAHYPSMEWIYSVRMELDTEKPVSGTVNFHNAGVILR